MKVNKKMYDHALLSALKNADNFMLCAHVNPDGDAIGSMLATARLLEKLGKNVTMVCQDPVPKKQLCLPGAENVFPPEWVQDQPFEAAIALDISTEGRMGSVYELYRRIPLTFQIDHHPGNTCFARYNFVDDMAGATGELIVALYEELGVPLDREAAFQLYCAISSDTVNFIAKSVRPYTFDCMEKLMEAGLDLAEAARVLFITKSRAYTAVLGKALSSMKYFAGGAATCMHLTRQDKESCGALDDDLHGIVNYGLNIDGVRMTFMADEDEKGWKVSLRALPGENAAEVAAVFGGGGHVLAAGCVIPGEYESVERRLMAEIEKALHP